MKAPLSKEFFHPKYLPTWFFIGLLYLLVRCLPYRWLLGIGNSLGKLIKRFEPYRILVAKINIRLCFENSDKDWQPIYQKHIFAMSRAVFEVAMSLFLPAKDFVVHSRHTGYEGVDKALAEGRGVLFLGVHTTSIGFGTQLITNRYPTYFMYHKAKNAVLDYMITRGRLKNCLGEIEHTRLREIFAKLKAGKCVWYGSDRDFGDKGAGASVFAPFYQMQAYTLSYYAKIAQKTGAAVIPVAGFYDNDSGQFIIRYLPEIVTDGLSDIEAASAMNKSIEQLLDGYEEQYYWIHRRFKTRPEGEPAVYPKKPREIRREKKIPCG